MSWLGRPPRLLPHQPIRTTRKEKQADGLSQYAP